MPKFTIKQDRANCIGCGACAAVCPANWLMKPDGKSAPKETEINDLGCNMAAAQGCPVKVIHIFEETGKQLI